MEWFIFSICATIIFAIQSVLFKTSSEKKCNKFLVTLTFMATVEIFALIFFIFNGINFNYLLLALILGILFATAFYIKTISQMTALESLPTNKVFPITSSSLILVVIYALIFFNESITWLQLSGIFLILISINLIHNNTKKSFPKGQKNKGLLFAFIAIPFGAIMTITNKYASLNLDLGLFIIITYFFLTIISFGSYQNSKKVPKDKSTKIRSIKLGLAIGVLNFAGFLALLTALQTGPLSLVASIHATFVILTVVIAKAAHNETLSLKQFSLVLLAVLGVIFLKI